MSDEKPKRPRKGYLPQIAVRVRPEWIEEFDAIAADSGWLYNRSDFVREAIEEWLDRKRRQRKK
jgi:Arc/MetJ-type ribon-helix-helix transcriptional regulator